MEKETVIEIKGIGKKYKINHEQGRYVTLRDILTDIIKKPLKFLTYKSRQIAGFEKKEQFWALKDVTFEVKKGDVIGIIGRNGAGKSTLLKILSQITPPTLGEIKIKGRVSSLLEVGTGFHPELTGRENIFLNGAILGMTRKEMAVRFDNIVEFAGIEKFLDTPVKYYSSGMYVRLAFSVAAHMEPDILIIDEVLAVGDAEFQKKCLDKMEYITQNEGRTIIFVSHNLATVQKLCKKVVLLENGRIKKVGETEEILNYYLNARAEQTINIKLEDRAATDSIKLTGINVLNADGTNRIKSGDKLKISLKYNSNYKKDIDGTRFYITIVSAFTKRNVLRLDSYITSDTITDAISPNGEIVCETDSINLTEGEYLLNIDFVIKGVNVDHIENAIGFNIEPNISKYNYQNNPDKNACDNLIKFSFKQVK